MQSHESAVRNDCSADPFAAIGFTSSCIDEYEREPKEETWNTPYRSFNVTLEGKSTVKHGGARLDYQLSPQHRLMVKANKTKTAQPFTAGQQPAPGGYGTTT